ncbi:hypothetical protein ACFVH7_25420 [Kitasatospora indigofera]|uniref:hypothetical protein n=1 Tax=Kitasatospora indigofera TaxID=67307 RepID=UPI0036258015
MIGRSRATGGTGGGPVVVEIEDVSGPSTFVELSEALAALWESLRPLPMGAVQAEAFRHFLTRPDALDLVTESIRRDGRLSLSFRMNDRLHAVWVSPAGAAPPPR